MKLRTCVGAEKSLYLHMLIYPVFATIVLLSPHYATDPKKRFKDTTSTLLFFMSVSPILVIIGYTIGILYSIRNRCRKTLRICIRIHFTLSFVNSTLTTIMEMRQDFLQNELRPTSTILLVSFFLWHYIFYGANLLHLYEKLNKQHGYPYSQMVLGIHIDTFMYIHLAVVWHSRLFSSITLIWWLVIYCNKTGKDKDVLDLMRFILLVLDIFNQFNVIPLHLGIRRRDLKFVQLYKLLNTYYLISLALSLGVQSVVDPHKSYNDRRNLYNIALILMLVLFLNSLVVERHLIYLYMKVFGEAGEILDKKLRAERLKMFMKSEKMAFLHVEIDQEDESFLGEGQFGIVRRGTMANSLWNARKNQKIIAIKYISTGFQPEENLKSIISEIRVIQTVKMGHENIVKFYGLTYNCRSTSTGADCGLGIVMEYCPLGSLQNHLRSRRNSLPINGLQSDDLNDLQRWAVEIGSAMQFLSKLKIIHGDLAARNVLLDAQKCVKVADFGMSSRLYHYQLYIKTNQSILPWRWMAPESLVDMKFSLKSDVWSFGVLLWEMYTLGNIPWAGFEWSSDFVLNIQAGNRLEKPAVVSDHLYQNIFLRCWGFNENQRCGFAEIKDYLENTYSINKALRNYFPSYVPIPNPPDYYQNVQL